MRTGQREVVVDMRTLEFMSSGCFKAFVTWIGRLEQLEVAQRYLIRLLSEKNYHWQKRSLGVLVTFAPDVVGLEVSGK
jgi:hypothetical protein